MAFDIRMWDIGFDRTGITEDAACVLAERYRAIRKWRRTPRGDKPVWIIVSCLDWDAPNPDYWLMNYVAFFDETQRWYVYLRGDKGRLPFADWFMSHGWRA